MSRFFIPEFNAAGTGRLGSSSKRGPLLLFILDVGMATEGAGAGNPALYWSISLFRVPLPTFGGIPSIVGYFCFREAALSLCCFSTWMLFLDCVVDVGTVSAGP